MKRFLAFVLCLLMVSSMVACGAPAPAASTAEPAAPTAAPVEQPTAAPEATEAPKGNPNTADFTYVDPAGSTFDVSKYYNDLGVECDFTLRATGGTVAVPDVASSMPKAKERYKIGFSVYYTVDEVGAMLLETMKTYAEICGVDLLVNDANYDQNAQNQAVEQWILEGIDGAIIAPCDFTGVKGALDALKAANIPVVTLNPALSGEADAVIMSECTEQGAMAAQLLIDHLKASNSTMEGVIVYQTLPFVHPNAATRAKGFKDAFAQFPGIEIVELTGIAPEEHYTAFEGALMNYGDKLIGAFGLYASATIGMMNAKKAASSDVPITSIDNDKVILEGIYNGDLLGSCCYSSTSPAIWCMNQMVNLLNGEEIPSAIFYPNTNVTKANVEEMFEFYYNGKTLADYIAGAVS